MKKLSALLVMLFLAATTIFSQSYYGQNGYNDDFTIFRGNRADTKTKLKQKTLEKLSKWETYINGVIVSSEARRYMEDSIESFLEDANNPEALKYGLRIVESRAKQDRMAPENFKIAGNGLTNQGLANLLFEVKKATPTGQTKTNSKQNINTTTTKNTSKKYWHGEATRSKGNYTYHIEAYVSYELPDFKEIVEGKAIEKMADEAVSGQGSLNYPYEDFNALILFGDEIAITISLCEFPDDIDDNGNDINEWEVSVDYYISENDKGNIFYKSFNNFNSALKEFKNQRDQYVKELENESSKKTKQITTKKQNSKTNSKTSKNSKKNTSSNENFQRELYRLRHEPHQTASSIGLDNELRRGIQYRYIYYDDGRMEQQYFVDLDGNIRSFHRDINGNYPILPYYSVPKKTREAALKSLE